MQETRSDLDYPESFIRDLMEAHAGKSPDETRKETEQPTSTSVLKFRYNE